MRIWLLTVGETLPMLDEEARKMRTALLALELVSRGHEVVWWTSTIDHLRKRELSKVSFTKQWQEALTVEFLAGPMYTRSLSLRRYLNHIVVALRFMRAARKSRRPNIIVASYPTPELAAAAAYVARRINVPLIVDVRDLWPEELLAQLSGPLRWIGIIATLPMFFLRRYAFRRARSISAVSPSYAAWASRKAGRVLEESPEVFTLGYQSNISRDGHEFAVSRLADRGVDFRRPIFSFVTSLNEGADIQMIVDAARLLERRATHVQIVIAGAGESASRLQQMISNLATVRYVGWIDASEIGALLSASLAGLILYKGHSQVSLSNKLFEYLSFGLPIILSLGGDARLLVEKEKIGTHVPPGHAHALADAIEDLLKDPATRREQAERAGKLFEKHFRAESVYSGFADYIERRASH